MRAHSALAALRLVGRGFDIVFPPCCVLCASTLEPGAVPVCATCWHRLPRILSPRCDRCGATSLTPAESGGCAACARSALGRLRAAAAFRLEAGAARVVRELKYRGWAALAGGMGAAMKEPALRLMGGEALQPAQTTLVPVPVTLARLRERGFNQARLLAEPLGATLGHPVLDVLERLPGRRPQAGLGRSERKVNVRGRVRASAGPEAGQPKAILLVDDVVTTGATAAACARALSEAGWRPLGVVSFARAWRSLEP
ncbi:MAG: double zinc ribbon domain-containing protein [Gemmatimonadetes bacterium]|nr:double zinc ribbon domain-containing protein [Gemmatimonadota bacterium]